MNENRKCHDCGVKEGQIHEWGCDMERCPFCGWQLISCNCASEMFQVDELSDELDIKRRAMITEKGRVPYIRYPVLCGKCGELWPDFFMVSDEEWNHYIQLNMQGTVICKECYQEIKQLIDSRE